MNSFRHLSKALSMGLAALLVGTVLTGCTKKTETPTPQAGAAKSTLALVKARGQLNCAIHPGQPGMSHLNASGQWEGFFIDYCRAVAAAVLGDPQKVKFMPVASNKRFTILQTGEADVLSRTTTWTMTRDTDLGVNFVGIMYYDGQGFLIPKRAKIRSSLDLNSASICITKGTTAEINTADYFIRNKMTFKSIVFENPEEAKLAFFAGRCDAITSDAFTLTGIRLVDAERPDDYEILPELLTKEPVGPVVRSDDEQWFEINKWVLNSLTMAEELGVTQANVAAQANTSGNPEVRKMLGVVPGLGRSLGLDEAWAMLAILATGNYGEIFSRHISPLEVERGQNNLYTKGGLIYPLPMR